MPLDTPTMFGLQEEPGWLGHFTRQSAPGASPPGTRMVKVLFEKGDAHQLGALCTVLGSVSHPDIQNGQPFYFVEWDDEPKVAVACVAWKLQVA